MDVRDKQQQLVKIMRRCSRANLGEAQAAATIIRRLVAELQPKIWRWTAGARVVTVPYGDWVSKKLDPSRLTAGKLKAVFMRNHSEVRHWDLLEKGYIGVLVHNTLFLLPADSAEPIF